MTNLLSRKLQNFVHLEQDDLDFLDTIIQHPKIVPAATDLVSEGDKPNDVHLILKGFACRYKILKDGGRQIMAYLVPGDLCDLHVFLLDNMDHSLGTLSVCEVVDIPRSVVLDMIKRPAISQGLLMSAMVDEGTLREWLVNLGRREAEQRVAHLMCELLARLRSVDLVSDADAYGLPITQVELADTTGISAVHVNRVLQKLRRDKLISFHGGQLIVLDRAGLEQLAGWNPNYLHLRRSAAL